VYDAPTIKPLIVERIANGEFVRQIAASDDMPCESTINAWLAADDAFRSQCARAREASADVFEGRVVDLVDQVVRGEVDAKAGAAAGNLLTWICKVRNRKVYGDKVEVDARVSVGGSIMDRLARSRDRIVEHEPLELVDGTRMPDDSSNDDDRQAA